MKSYRTLCFSVLAHAALAAIAFKTPTAPPRTAANLNWIDIEKSEQLDEPTPDAHQVVDTEEGGEMRAVPNARLGRRNQVVEHESVSPLSPTHRGGSLGSSDGLDNGPVKSESSALSLADLGLRGLGGESLRALAGADQAFQGVPTAKKTLITTREFQFHGFYQRVKDQLKVHWSPEVQERSLTLMQIGGAVVGSKPLVTRLTVYLEPSGRVSKIKMTHKSGVTDIDEAAVLAFEKAAKFPNPPKGMEDSDGYVRINWEFILHPVKPALKIADNTEPNPTRQID